MQQTAGGRGYGANGFNHVDPTHCKEYFFDVIFLLRPEATEKLVILLFTIHFYCVITVQTTSFAAGVK